MEPQPDPLAKIKERTAQARSEKLGYVFFRNVELHALAARIPDDCPQRELLSLRKTESRPDYGSCSVPIDAIERAIDVVESAEVARIAADPVEAFEPEPVAEDAAD